MRDREIGEFHRNKRFLFCATGFVVMGFMLGGGANVFSKEPAAHVNVDVRALATPPSQSRMFGINFSPYLDGQDPNHLTPISEAQIQSRMELVAPYTEWVRTFSMVDGLEKSGAIAHSLGLKAALGAWIGPENTQESIDRNHLNIANLIAAGQKGEADLLIVGSEVLHRGDVAPETLIAYIHEVKTAVPGIPVAVADIDENLLKAPTVMSAADILFVNIYPYWERTRVEWSLFTVLARYRRMVDFSGGKAVYLSETGWPSCGDVLGDAVPTAMNASTHLFGFQTMVKSLAIPSFYFEAFDESWKADSEGPQGACWGMWDKGGSLKPGNNSFFQGEVAPNTWSGLSPVGGSGTPSILLLSAPSYGSSSQELFGQVLHVSPDDHHLSLYISVNNRWYMKPLDTEPYFLFQPDGLWHSPVVTGGQDSVAEKFRVYLFPGNYVPPKVMDASDLPADFATKALTVSELYRTPNALSGAITAPANGAVVSGPTLIHAEVQSNRGVVGVVFSIDGVAVSTDIFHPYEYLWNPASVPSGSHTLKAKVMEITGASVESSIQVNR